ncbi:enoyl-CoA hydratase/isomerase family protein, partial [Streptomyces sp. NPDC058953]|uniref:enoyl-CoA hydratase/isomerase family protein n=1 Tax=Streptomyces sp. NPDC058953 TaxID=3346676 RepID=UPI00367E6CB3
METAGSGPEPRVVCDVAEGVATVVIRHPAKRNAMTTAMWRTVPVLLERLAADPAVRVLVLTGEGDTFCAGAAPVSQHDIIPPALAYQSWVGGGLTEVV